MKDNKLQVIIEEQGLVKSDVQKLVEAFGGPFDEAGEILANYKQIEVTSEDQTDLMKEAREKRLLLKKARTTVENNRKELKADIVKQGRAIDSIARYVKEEIEPAEEYLELQEKFAEIKQAEAKAQLKAERIEKLMQYTDDISVYSLDVITAEQFDALLATLKAQHEAEQKRIADEAKAQEDARKAEELRIAEQAKENARLREEADKREAEIERLRVVEANKLALIQKEADAKLVKERAGREKLEQAERERIAEENRKQAEADKTERDALLAPDKEKILNFVAGLEIVRTQKLPAVKTKQAQDILEEVDKAIKMVIDAATVKARLL